MGKFITSVRFKVKEGKSEEFIKKSKEIGKYEQAIDNFTFQTGEDTFCFVGIFENEQAIIEARPHMISNLDKILSFNQDSIFNKSKIVGSRHGSLLSVTDKSRWTLDLINRSHEILYDKKMSPPKVIENQ